jgi:hypothetical protein
MGVHRPVVSCLVAVLPPSLGFLPSAVRVEEWKAAIVVEAEAPSRRAAEDLEERCAVGNPSPSLSGAAACAARCVASLLR